MRKMLVVGNWKMQGSHALTENLVGKIVQDLPATPSKNSPEVVLCPPFVYLEQANALIARSKHPHLHLGAQDVSLHQEGAYTGQISASMLAEKHCHYVIVGHSERRQYCAETDEIVAGKMLAAINANLIPIVCLGESLKEHQTNQTEAVLLRQLRALLDKGGIASIQRSVLAYEPIWAIGTGKTATPDEAESVHSLLRKELASHDQKTADSVSILYGGSVKPDNVAELFNMPDIDGGLIGGAALKADDFLTIVAQAARKR